MSEPIIDAPIDASSEPRAPEVSSHPVAAPTEADIVGYLKAVNPFGFGEGEIKVIDIDPQVFSPHFNYLIETPRGRAVMRLKGPEWGSPLDGIENEYNILKFVERYEVAPQALHFDHAGIKSSPLMLTEFLEGKLFTELTVDEQRQLLPPIGSLIAEINSIPIDDAMLPFDYPLTSYAPHRDKWWRRVQEAEAIPRLGEFVSMAQALLPRGEALIDKFEPTLKAVIERGDSCFVFVSSHASHLMVTDQGLRFVNWEAVRVGDPSFTLAVFLSSIADAPFYEEALRTLIARYLELRPVADFEAILRQRLAERAISDYTWLLWTESKKLQDQELDAAKLAAWYERAAKMVIAA